MDYRKILNTTVTGLRPSGIRKYFGMLEGMEDVINLGVGQPDFEMPREAQKAILEAASEGHLAYTANAGLPELRESISDYLKRRFELSFRAEDEILVTVGGSEAIDLCLRALLEPGDEVIVPEPTFVCYGPLAKLAGGVEVPVATDAAHGFRLTPEALRAAITPRTKLLVLPFPTNPTGAVMPREALEAIGEVLRGTDIMVLSDEVYAELTFGRRHVSPATIPSLRDRTIVIGSASKTLAMTGARLGFAAGPEPVIAAMTRIHQYGIMSAPTLAQVAAAEAFRSCDENIERMKHSYDRRRCMMMGGFAAMGLPCVEPEGTFYLFPDISASGLTSEEFCERLLREGRVLAIPGNAFGESGEGHIRICYAYSEESLREALRRLAAFWTKVARRAA